MVDAVADAEVEVEVAVSVAFAHVALVTEVRVLFSVKSAH